MKPVWFIERDGIQAAFISYMYTSHNGIFVQGNLLVKHAAGSSWPVNAEKESTFHLS